MPEIIEFSNRISYSNTPLIPLRQYPPNRLEPIKSRHVSTGYREGAGSKVYNRPEAKAVVDEIQQCISNPLYDGKTMGVISLQSEGQAQLIEKLLIEQIGPEEMEKRHMICGDAYAFQGDERDIMFLSMVAAPGETAMRALMTEKDKRRFNVAVSRAKDQLWLFYSPTLNDFRNKNCLRYQLISYCENPSKEILESNRLLCESDFEKMVFDQITARGYRVIPQVEVAGYRIDLVVEGSKGRIAVECDGDQWHGPDRFDHDMNRQRILERCGWKFWRVRGSVFYYNPEKALSTLWDTLDYYEIEPEQLEPSAIKQIENDREVPLETNRSNEQLEGIVLGSETKEITHQNDNLIFPKRNQLNLFTSLDEVAVGLNQIDTDASTSSEFVSIAEKPEGNFQSEYKLNSINKNASLTSPKVDLSQYLIDNGYEIVDKRSKNGALWLIGGQELSPLISALKKEQIQFTFAYNGSKSTAKRPAWFTSFQN
jgi:very-short-patch-repair endonuclease